MLEAIHIIHHAHTDLGYTDSPDAALEVHLAGLRRAMELAAQDLLQPDEGRFRWTCEALGVVAEYLRRFPQEEGRLARLVEAGSIEVAALPWNLSPALAAGEWQAMRELYRPLRQRFRATVAMQNDVNGLPWGCLPGLLADGARALWFGMNTYSGGSPFPIPSAVRWQGPDGADLLVWAGYAYCEGFSWFHEETWRRGPVPPQRDVWFHEPEEGDIWDASPEGLRRARETLLETMAGKLSGYPYRALPLQVTNHHRIDNDLPCPLLPAFVRAWNAAGLSPRLEMSTPARFLDALEGDPAFAPATARGDWPDWWGDGSPSMGRELPWGQQAKARLSRLPAVAERLGTPAPDLAEAWEIAFRTTEHTFGGYESVARPWDLRAGAGWHHKSLLFHQALDRALAAETETLRRAPDYARVTAAQGVSVLNPEAGSLGGWVEIGLQRWPQPPGALRDEAGRTYPLEIVWQPEWSAPDPAAPEETAVPAGVWPLQPVRGRAWVPCEGGSIRHLALVPEEPGPGQAAEPQGEDGTWRWHWDGGVLRSLRHLASGTEVVDAGGEFPFGALIWERFEAPRAWDLLAARDPALSEHRHLDAPTPEGWENVPGHYGPRWRWRRRHPGWHAAEQELRLLPDGSVEMHTRVWVQEQLLPVGLWLALPLAPESAEAVYDSLGVPTRVGTDQLPGSCGEIVGGLQAVGAITPGAAVVVDCADTPIIAPGGIHTRTGRIAARPARPHWYPCLLATWWATNFPHCRATCIETRHVLRVAGAWPAPESSELLAWPSR